MKPHFVMHFIICDSNNGGDIAVLIYLLTQDDVRTNIQGPFGTTLLHFACSLVNELPLDVFKYFDRKKGFEY
jgi:hypothetical protein